jgi:hypothetical protein
MSKMLTLVTDVTWPAKNACTNKKSPARDSSIHALHAWLLPSFPPALALTVSSSPCFSGIKNARAIRGGITITLRRSASFFRFPASLSGLLLYE